MASRKEKYPDTKTFIYYNANPKGKITCDCVARAICTALDEPYETVLKEMFETQIETGYEYTDVKCYDKYLVSKGWIKMKQPRKSNNKKYTGDEFCRLLNNDIQAVGKSIIANIGGNHVVCIKETDGLHGTFRVHDIWDSTGGCIGNYWVKG